MRHPRAIAAYTSVLFALLLTLTCGSVHAQVLPFDPTDWTLDRGATESWTTVAPGALVTNAHPRGQGHTDYTLVDPISHKPNDAQQGNLRWAWPRLQDIQGATTGGTVTVDNFNPNVSSATKVNESGGLQPGDALAVFNNNGVPAANQFTIVPPANFGPDNGGFSYNQNPSATDYHDYAVAPAVHNDFLLADGSRKATDAEIAAMPNVVPNVYAGIESALRNSAPTAQWSIGTTITLPALTGQNPTVIPVPAGRFGVDIYSPGSGTLINGVPAPTVQRAFVRVSWKNTVNTGAGTFNNGATSAGAGGVNDPSNSRIYAIDLSQQGWIHVQSANLPPASFPNGINPATGVATGSTADQLVVTLYVLTPDSLSDKTKYVNPPVVTADAVRFTAQTFASNTNLGPINGQGRVLGPVIGSQNTPLSLTTPLTARDSLSPVFFVAREEQVIDTTTLRSYVDPTNVNSAAAVDPTAIATVPVFYALDNRPEQDNNNATDAFGKPVVNSAANSIAKVRWRYVGTPDLGSGTSSASPLLANVRCRDGQVRPILYYVTTNADGTVGHVYALNPYGNTTTQTTGAYWIYPSYRPLTAADYNANGTPKVPTPFYDPNYSFPSSVTRPAGGYPTTFTFGADQSTQGTTALVTKTLYYDGDITRDTSGNYSLNSSTQISFGGATGAPVLVDDVDGKSVATVPANAPQLLIVPNSNGHVYAFDAGGRGDFDPPVGGGTTPAANSTSGTTQRIWTWPHFGADAYHANAVLHANPTGGYPSPTLGFTYINPFQNEAARGGFLTTPAYDNTVRLPPPAGVVPATDSGGAIVLGDAVGRVYALRNRHDVLVGTGANAVPIYQERRYWTYPAANKDPLNDSVSTVALFHPTGAGGAVSGNQVYFTCGGRVYCLNNSVVSNALPYTPTLKWVYPPTGNATPPFQDPNNPTATAPLSPGFNAAAPVLINKSQFTTVLPATGKIVDPTYTTTQDHCYVLAQDGTLYNIDANTGTIISAGDTVIGTFLNSTPIAARVTPNASIYVGTAPTTNPGIPAIVFADDYGNIFGLRAGEEPIPSSSYYTSPVGSTTYNPVIWGFADAGGQRIAAAAFSNSAIVEGDESGQVRCYYNQTGASVPDSEFTGPGGTHSPVTIDLRGVDLYAQSHWKNFGTTETPAERDNNPNTKDANGNIIGDPITHTSPLGTNIGGQLGADWGEYLYISAWGVYHAMPTKAGGKFVGTTAPVLTVHVQVLQPGGQYEEVHDVQVQLQSDMLTQYPTSGTQNDDGSGKNLWPDDRGIPLSNHLNLSISGEDLNNESMNNPTGYGKLQGPDNNVFPWVIRAKVLIEPTADHPYLPGASGLRVRVSATAQQTIVDTTMPNLLPTPYSNQSNYLTAGLRDPYGKNSDGAPGQLFAGPPQLGLGVRGKPRAIFIANPLAVSTSGDGGNGSQNLSGSPNIIGWAGSVSLYPYPELLGNNNRTNAGQSGYKSLFAPIPMAQDGQTTTYTAVDPTGTQVSQPLRVAERSALAFINDGQNHDVKLRANISPQVWHGDYTSVMNPLPWDQLPDDGNVTPDYPAIAANNIHVKSGGVDASTTDVVLAHPILPNGSTDPTQRLLVGTPLDFQIDVPKYQPANLNAGVWKSSATGTIYGSQYTFQDGVVGGNPSTLPTGPPTSPVLGPMIAGNIRQPLASLSQTAADGSKAFPAAGYVSRMLLILQVEQGNSLGRTGRFQPGNLQPSFTNADSAKLPNREVHFGLAVAPRFSLDTTNDPQTAQVVDLGNEAAGTGYSDPFTQSNLFGGASYFRIPFAPSGTGFYQTTTANASVTSPWDDVKGTLGAQSLGSFFQPFTLVNNSNVNLVDVRIAKLLGKPHAFANIVDVLSANPDPNNPPDPFNPTDLNQGGTASAARFSSDIINDLLVAPLPLMPYSGPSVINSGSKSVGNIGLVSSFDHLQLFAASRTTAGAQTQTRIGERSVYPIYNPSLASNASAIETLAEKLIAGTSSGGITVGQGLLLAGPTAGKWFTDGATAMQPYPTVHKPRAGDANGTTASVPDVPHDYNSNSAIGIYGTTNNIPAAPAQPKIGMAIPPGTPAGSYSASVYAFEDSLPVQWRDYQSTISPVVNGKAVPYSVLQNDHDGVLNVNRAGNVVEAYTVNPLKVTVNVTEARLTGGNPTVGTSSTANSTYDSDRGVLSQIDPLGTGFQGANLLPAVAPVLGAAANNGKFTQSRMLMFWTTNRQQEITTSNPYMKTPLGSTALVPQPYAPYGLAYSTLQVPYTLYQRTDGSVVFTPDYQFNLIGTGTNANARWWGAPNSAGGNFPYVLYPGYYTSGTRRYQPFGYDTLFPTTASNNVPYVPGTANPASVRYASPGVAMAISIGANGSLDPTDTEGYLVFQGQVEKARAVTAALSTTQAQFVDSRSFYVPLTNVGTTLGIPAPISAVQSLLNDPTMPKLSPKPLLVKFTAADNSDPNVKRPAQKFLYLFWHSGAQGRTSLYYNVNVQSDPTQAFQSSGWLQDPTANGNGFGDQRLPTPGSLTWQSDPSPVYRRVRVATTAADGTTVVGDIDAIDVAYTGVLKGRQKVEVLMSRFAIHRVAEAGFTDPTKQYLPGQLELLPLPEVHQEVMHRTGTTFDARDAAWYLGPDSDPNGIGGTIKLELLRANGQHDTLNFRDDNKAQLGRYDKASGLTYYDVIARDPNNPQTIDKSAGSPSGGQAVVDVRSGTVSFPNIAPAPNDTVLVSYTPRVIRLSAGRDSSNVDHASNSPFANDPALTSPGGVSVPGNNTNPVLIFDRAPNLRAGFTAPRVVFNANGTAATVATAPPLNRMWVVYRKTNPSADKSGEKQTLFYKAMRLTAILPRPVKINTNQQIAGLTITGNRGPYEVDWIRNRVYFTEKDEGNTVAINYTYANPDGSTANSGNINYIVGWSDELFTSTLDKNGLVTGYVTQPEQAVPLNTSVNEGQVTAVKDPVVDKLWLFWTSSRNGTNDLYYETIAPQFYPTSSIQR